MKLYIILLILQIYCMLSNSMFAQNQYYEHMKAVENDMVLLRNENLILPIKNIYPKNILIIAYKSIFCLPFYQMCRRYANVEMVIVSDIRDFMLMDKTNIDLCIIATDTTEYILKMGINLEIPNILCYFAEPNEKISKATVEAYDSFILCNSKDTLNQQIAAQMIFGAITFKGTLKTKISNDYDINYGLKTDSAIRLKYTVPEELDIDSSYINHKIDSIINNAISKYAFPGCQLLLAKQGKIFFYKNYGYLTYDSINAVDDDDLFDLASVTKIMAPLPCLMKLYEQQKFDLDDKLSDYLKFLRNSNKEDITFREALTHQAQLKSWIAFWKTLKDDEGNYKPKTIKTKQTKYYNIKIAEDKYLHRKYYKKVYQIIADSELEKEKKYLYSDLSFYLYPEIIEKLSKEDYEKYLYQNFYKKIGADRLVYRPLKYFDKTNIAPTERDTFFRGELIHGRVHDEGAILLDGVSGHAGLFGNANDLAKMMQMYLNYGTYGGERFLADSTLKIFTSYQYENNRRGLGFDKQLLSNPQLGTASEKASKSSFGHTGYTGTFVWADPENQLLMIFTTNRVYPSRDNKNLMILNVRTSIHSLFY